MDVPDLLAGYAVARAFISSNSTDWYRFDLHIRPTTPLLSALAILLVALLSHAPACAPSGA